MPVMVIVVLIYQTTLFSIVISPEFFKCIPIQAFLPLIPILTDSKALNELFKKDPLQKSHHYLIQNLMVGILRLNVLI